MVHYLKLPLSLEHGMRLFDVHGVLRFHQSPWLAPNIEKNSTLRAAAKNYFEKEFFKLRNNSIYGKSCENQKKRTEINPTTSEQRSQKLHEMPH